PRPAAVPTASDVSPPLPLRRQQDLAPGEILLSAWRGGRAPDRSGGRGAAAEVEVAELRVGEQLLRRAGREHPAEVEDAADVGHLQRPPRVLLDEQHRDAGLPHAVDLLED